MLRQLLWRTVSLRDASQEGMSSLKSPAEDAPWLGARPVLLAPVRYVLCNAAGFERVHADPR